MFERGSAPHTRQGSFTHTPSRFDTPLCPIYPLSEGIPSSFGGSRGVPDISQDFEGSHHRLGKGCQFLGVEFYSTPFVFLTDTFTGMFLCFCELGGGQTLVSNAALCFAYAQFLQLGFPSGTSVLFIRSVISETFSGTQSELQI